MDRKEAGGMKKIRYSHLFGVLVCFLAMAAVLYAERSGVKYEAGAVKYAYMPQEAYIYPQMEEWQRTCLFLMDSRQDESGKALDQFRQILKDMRVGYQVVDLADQELPGLDSYQTAVVALSDLSVLGEEALTLCRWVEAGGRALFPLTLQREITLDLIAPKLGILEASYENAMVESMYMEEGFIIGGGRAFTVTDPYESALLVSVEEKCRVYAYEEDSRVPLIWECGYGAGKFVVDNFGLCEKAYRGFYAASYSLLEDICVYPVINSSAFYIDDFPSPVPQGDGEYIRRDFGMSISDFYTNVWWPDVRGLAKRFGIRYTGVMIENYEDQVSGELIRNFDQARYHYFGNMLLDMGGELGYHGYNHQPLCLDSFHYEEDLGYQEWESMEKMEESVKELADFARELFPLERFSVYVPPSNVLSPEGREILRDQGIQTIAAIYFPGGSGYEQEFEVAEDGIVEAPRIISGCSIDSYMQIAAASELNLHFVNSHFLHPDDLLDPDRGATIGWRKLKEEFTGYLEWLYRSAPQIRNQTGSEQAGAIQRFSNLSLWRETTKEEFYMDIDGFYDEAYFLVRVNEGTAGQVEGGELTHLTGNLYLLHAKNKEITMKR